MFIVYDYTRNVQEIEQITRKKLQSLLITTIFQLATLQKKFLTFILFQRGDQKG